MTPDRERDARICDAALDRPALERETSIVEECAGELKTTQLTIKDSVAGASALRSEMDSLSALASEIRVAYVSVQETDDLFLHFRPESDATGVEFADDWDHVSADTAKRKRILVAQAGSEGSTIEPIALEALREELKTTQLTIRDSMAAASALRSEMHSLRALATEIRAEYSSVQETARGALERGATVESRLGAIESRLGRLGDLEEVRREIEKRFDALNALAQEVKANTDAVDRQRGLVEQLACKLVDGLKAGGAADAFRSPGAATPAQRSLTIGKVARCVQTMSNLRVSKTIVLNKYVEVAAVFTILALVSAFVLDSVSRTADLVGPPVGPPVVTPPAPVPSTAVPDLPSATSGTTSSEGSLDSATAVQRLTSTRQAASVDVETPATGGATEFVGTLSIRSTPDKAAVHIDRERVGETPLILPRLRAGAHAIWIEHDGYQRWTAGLNVPAGELTEVTATLQAEPGR